MMLGVLALAGCQSAGDEPQVATLEEPASEATPTPQDSTDGTQTVLEKWLTSQKRLVKCYRENGAPDYPDVDQWGQPQVEAGTVAIPEDKMRQVLEACEEFATPIPPEVAALVNAESGPSDAQRAAIKEYAECMQDNGAPQFPDPGPDGWAGDFEDPNAPGAQGAAQTCAPIFEELDPADG